jgi:hypothetical protein
MFEDGKLIETGTHTELLAQQDSKYRAFYLCHIGQEEDEEDTKGASVDDDSSTQVEDEDAQVWDDTTNTGGDEGATSSKAEDDHALAIAEKDGKPGRARGRGRSAGQDSGFQVAEDSSM